MLRLKLTDIFAVVLKVALLFPLCKQKGSSNTHMLSFDFLQWAKENIIREKEMDDDELLDIVGDLCEFIVHQVIHKDSDFHDPTSVIGHQKDCRRLREWQGLKLGHNIVDTM